MSELYRILLKANGVVGFRSNDDFDVPNRVPDSSPGPVPSPSSTPSTTTHKRTRKQTKVCSCYLQSPSCLYHGLPIIVTH